MDITLTMQQQKRIEIIERTLRNDPTVVEAAMVLGVSERQCYQIKARVKEQGVKGVLHQPDGRVRSLLLTFLVASLSSSSRCKGRV
jgi:hypothetical protein